MNASRIFQFHTIEDAELFVSHMLRWLTEDQCWIFIGSVTEGRIVTVHTTVPRGLMTETRAKAIQHGALATVDTRKPSALPNARFWLWWNCDWVKITLKPGQRISFSQCHSTDEGHAWSAEAFEYPDDEPFIHNESGSGGSDCDGPIEEWRNFRCHVSNLKELAHDEYEFDGKTCHNPDRPLWDLMSSHQRDQYAEAAGY